MAKQSRPQRGAMERVLREPKHGQLRSGRGGVRTACVLLAAALLAATADVAAAQPNGTAGAGGERCASARLEPRDHPDPQLKGEGRDLSDRLAQSGGVICPPDEVDPAMKAPTPETGDTPVIRPPGGPGGDRSVPPK